MSDSPGTSSGLLRLLACVAVVLLVAVGCSEDEQADYSRQNSEEFFQACTAPELDDQLVTRICDCVFSEAQTSVPYERFVAIEDGFIADPTSSLPQDLVDVIADCVTTEAHLDELAS